MKRMKRRLFPKLFPILAAGSLGLAIAVARLWGVSYWWVTETMHVSTGDGERNIKLYGVTSAPGALVLSRAEGFADLGSGGWSFQAWPRDFMDFRWTQGLWFAHESNVIYETLLIPDWFLTLLLLILPAVWLRRFRSERRKQREGLCLVCGYDLRAHVPGQLCPECGMVVPADLAPKPMEGSP